MHELGHSWQKAFFEYLSKPAEDMQRECVALGTLLVAQSGPYRHICMLIG